MQPSGISRDDFLSLVEAAILAPSADNVHQRSYLVDRTQVSFAQQRGPSTVIACELCAGVAAAEVLKILLQRGPVLAAPWGLHFDAKYVYKRTWRPMGYRNPLQRIAQAIARRQLRDLAEHADGLA